MVRLKERDWAMICPETFLIGDTLLKIRPFALQDITELYAVVSRLKNIKSVTDIFSEENREEFLRILREECPELMEKACGLHRDDILNLPSGIAAELLSVIADANLKSYEGLTKNLPAVLMQAARIAPLILLMFSSNSSAAGTDGETSADIPPAK